MGGELVGNKDPVCPYCSQPLDKMPGRKKSCPHCGQSIYVRTRPQDGQRVLVTERAAAQIEKQWTAHSYRNRAMTGIDQAEFDAEKRSAEACHGGSVSEGDIIWGMLNRNSIEHARAGNWGLYRNTRLAMAQLLQSEDQLLRALEMYFEVIYLDANGPNNVGGMISDPSLLAQFPPFTRESAFMAPGIVSEVAGIADSLGLSESELESRFMLVAEAVHRSMRLPVPAVDAWHEMREALPQ